MASNEAGALFSGRSPSPSHREVHRLVQDIAEEVRKAEGGNKAAGTRVRKAMQDVKQAAQDVRKDILESRAPSS
jgi:hypothetical protein